MPLPPFTFWSSAIKQEVAFTTSQLNGFREYCELTTEAEAKKETLTAELQAQYEKQIGELPPGIYVRTVTLCLNYIKEGIKSRTSGRQLNEAGTSLVVDFFILCESEVYGTCPSSLEQALLAQAAMVNFGSAGFITIQQDLGDSATLVTGTPFPSQMPFFFVPPSPPFPPPPPCIAECDVFTDGADKDMQSVCIHFQPYGKSSCRMPRFSSSEPCSAGHTLCTQHACYEKTDKKPKKCLKKLTKKGKAKKKCKKKKFYKKCKLSCCAWGYQ